MSLAYLNDDRADDLAEELVTNLTDDLPAAPTIDLTSADFTYEEDNDSDLYQDVDDVSLADLTEVKLEGTGVFDTMMAAIDLHLAREFKNNRISGTEYAKIYVETISSTMGQAVQFLLQKETAHWQAVTAQMQARVADIAVTQARIELEKTKLEAATAQYNMESSKATVALTMMGVANANAQHLLLMSQVEEQRYKVSDLLPLTKEQQEYQVNTLMVDQHKLLQEQMEAERSKTLDTRTNGTVIAGSVGKQKDLYTQQIDSFVKDSQYKATKMFFDAWVTRKTLDEGFWEPDQLNEDNLNEVLTNIRNANDF